MSPTGCRTRSHSRDRCWTVHDLPSVVAGPPYVDAKAKLVDEIAAANRCRAVYAELADLNLLEAVRA